MDLTNSFSCKHRPSPGHESPVTEQPVGHKQATGHHADPTPGERHPAVIKTIQKRPQQPPMSQSTAPEEPLGTPRQSSAAPSIQISMPVKTILDLKCFSDQTAVIKMLRNYNLHLGGLSDHAPYIEGEFQELRRLRTALYDMMGVEKPSIHDDQPSIGSESPMTEQPVIQQVRTGQQSVHMAGKRHPAGNRSSTTNTDPAANVQQGRVSSQRRPKPPPSDQRKSHQKNRMHLSLNLRGASSPRESDRSDGSSFYSLSEDRSYFGATSKTPISEPMSLPIDLTSTLTDKLKLSTDVTSKAYGETSKYDSGSATPRDKPSNPTKKNPIPAPSTLTRSFPVDTAVLNYVMCFRKEVFRKCHVPGAIELKIEDFQDFSNLILSVADAKFANFLEKAVVMLSVECEKYQSILRGEDIDLTEYPPETRARIAEVISRAGTRMEILTQAYEGGVHLVGPSSSLLGFMQNWKGKAFDFQKEMREANVGGASPGHPCSPSVNDKYRQSPTRSDHSHTTARTVESSESGKTRIRNGSPSTEILRSASDVTSKYSKVYSDHSKGRSDLSLKSEGDSSSVTPRDKPSNPSMKEPFPAPSPLTRSLPVDTSILSYIRCFRKEVLQEYKIPGKLELSFEHSNGFSNVILTLIDPKFSDYLNKAATALPLEFEKYRSHVREDIDLREYPPERRARIAKEISQEGKDMRILTQAYGDGVHLIGPSSCVLAFMQIWKKKAFYYQSKMIWTNQEANVVGASSSQPRSLPVQSPTRSDHNFTSPRSLTEDFSDSGKTKTRNGPTSTDNLRFLSVSSISSKVYSETSKGRSDLSPKSEGDSGSAAPRDKPSNPTKKDQVPSPSTLTGSFLVDTVVLNYIRCFRKEVLQKYNVPGACQLRIEDLQGFSNVTLTLTDPKFNNYLEGALSSLSAELEKFQSLVQEDIDLTEYPPEMRARIADDMSRAGMRMEILTHSYRDGVHLVGPSSSLLGFMQNWKGKAFYYQKEMREANVGGASLGPLHSSAAQVPCRQSPNHNDHSVTMQRAQKMDTESGRTGSRHESRSGKSPKSKPNTSPPSSKPPPWK